MVQETFRNLLDLGPEFPVDGSQFDRLLADGVLLHAGSLESGAGEGRGLSARWVARGGSPRDLL